MTNIYNRDLKEKRKMERQTTSNEGQSGVSNQNISSLAVGNFTKDHDTADVDPLSGTINDSVPILKRDPHESVGTYKMDAPSLFERHVIFDHISWPVEKTPNTVLATYDVPYDLFNKGGKVFPFLALMPNYKWVTTNTIEFKMTASVSPFSVGQLAMIWFPGISYDISGNHYGGATYSPARNGNSMIDCDMSILDLGDENAVTLKVPITSPRSAFATRFYKPAFDGSNARINMLSEDFNSFGKLVITSFSPLRGVAETEDQNVGVTLSASFGIPDMNILVGSHNVIIPPGRTEAGVVGALLGTELLGAAMNRITERVGEHCTDFTINANGIGITNTSTTNDQRVVSTVAYVEKDVENGAIETNDGMIVKDLREMCRKRSRIAVHNWTSIMAAGYVFAGTVIDPLYTQFYTGPTIGSDGRVELSNLGTVASAFGYWRGSITYTIEVVANAYCRGSLLFYVLPRNITKPDSLEAMIALPHARLNISETRRIEIKIPYNYGTPWTPVGYWGLVPVGDVVELRLLNAAIDELKIVVMNPIRTKSKDDISTFTVNVYVHSDDIEFKVPRLNTNLHQSGKRAIPTTEGNLPHAPQVNIYGDEDTLAKPTTFRNDHMDLGQLLTRRMPLYPVKLTSNFMKIVFPVPLALEYTTTDVYGEGPFYYGRDNLYSHFASMFAWETGSQVVSLSALGNPALRLDVRGIVLYEDDPRYFSQFKREMTITPITEAVYDDAMFQQGAFFYNMSLSQNVEFVVPWYSAEKYRPAGLVAVSKGAPTDPSPCFFSNWISHVVCFGKRIS